jgi:protein-tyrosine phosphatase
MNTTEIPFTANKIEDHLWLGDIDSSENIPALNTHNITHILTVLDYKPEVPDNECRIRQHIPVLDMPSVNLIDKFDSCYEFIDQAVSNNRNVLVHCHAGKNNDMTTSSI